MILTPLPLYHIFSLTANCLVFMTLGARERADHQSARHPRLRQGNGAGTSFTAITGVNTLFNALVNNRILRQLDFSSLRLTLGGGMAVQKAVAENWKQVTGVPLIEAYGLTETSPAATINPLDLPEYNGAIGLPIPSTEVIAARRRRPRGAARAAGRDLHPRTAGDGGLLAASRGDRQGPGRGRLARDRRHRRDGRARLRAHRRPQEGHDPGVRIQRLSERDRGVVAMHPGVLECAAVGVPDAKSGEAVKLFVVRKDAGARPRRALLAHCREHLTGYKCPREVEFRDELPKTNVGKILRRELRDEARRKAGMTMSHDASSSRQEPRAARGADARRRQPERRHLRRLGDVAGRHRRVGSGGAPRARADRDRRGEFVRVQAAGPDRRPGELSTPRSPRSAARRSPSTSRSMRSEIRAR